MVVCGGEAEDGERAACGGDGVRWVLLVHERFGLGVRGRWAVQEDRDRELIAFDPVI